MVEISENMQADYKAKHAFTTTPRAASACEPQRLPPQALEPPHSRRTCSRTDLDWRHAGRLSHTHDTGIKPHEGPRCIAVRRARRAPGLMYSGRVCVCVVRNVSNGVQIRATQLDTQNIHMPGGLSLMLNSPWSMPGGASP